MTDWFLIISLVITFGTMFLMLCWWLWENLAVLDFEWRRKPPEDDSFEEWLGEQPPEKE
jgi:hypothetical protein